MTFMIEGLGPAQIQRNEYTSGGVIERFITDVQTLKSVFDQRPGTGGTDTLITSTDYNNLILALRDLADLAQNGNTEGDNPAVTYYLTDYMARDLDVIFRSLKAVDLSKDSPLIEGGGIIDIGSALKVLNWQNLAGFGVAEILTSAVQFDQVSPTRSLQSMIELEYVKEGNDMIFDALSGLESALQITQRVLDTLQIIQNIANMVSVSTPGNFTWPPVKLGDLSQASIDALLNHYGGIPFIVNSTSMSLQSAYDADIAFSSTGEGTFFAEAITSQFSVSDLDTDTDADLIDARYSFYTKVYRLAASAHFTQIIPTANPTSTAPAELLRAKSALLAYVAQLESTEGISRDTVNTLPYFLYNVALDISTVFLNHVSPTDPDPHPEQFVNAVKEWILDNQDKKIGGTTEADASGNIQNRVTQSIRAAESLNDVKKEEVRRYMFLFEQFYKSSSAVLQKVSQIIEKLAQGIAR